MSRELPPYIYDRFGRLSVVIRCPADEKHPRPWLKQVATGLPSDQVDAAEDMRRRLQAEVDAGLTDSTVAAYAQKWLRDREKRGLSSYADDESRLRNHVLPVLGDMALVDVRPRHIRQLVLDLQGKMAERTRANVLTVVTQLFNDAVADELLLANPVVIKKSERPENIDKNPEWRQTAVFSREEIELIISDRRTPEDRRVFYAIMFLGGMRFGETAARRWRHYDETCAPLHRLVLSTSWSTRRKIEKTTKTKRVRWMPVHPVLAHILAEWKHVGFREWFGRAPTPDDLIVPSRTGVFRNANTMLNNFHADVMRLGLRPRRQHDTRRTLVSLAIDDGAVKDRLKWCTHGRPASSDAIDGYDEADWRAMCAEVAKLNIRLRSPDQLPLRATVIIGIDPALPGTDETHLQFLHPQAHSGVIRPNEPRRLLPKPLILEDHIVQKDTLTDVGGRFRIPSAPPTTSNDFDQVEQPKDGCKLTANDLAEVERLLALAVEAIDEPLPARAKQLVLNALDLLRGGS